MTYQKLNDFYFNAILASLVAFLFIWAVLPTQPKQRYEYHTILSHDTVFIYSQSEKLIGTYLINETVNNFDSIIINDNL